MIVEKHLFVPLFHAINERTTSLSLSACFVKYHSTSNHQIDTNKSWKLCNRIRLAFYVIYHVTFSVKFKPAWITDILTVNWLKCFKLCLFNEILSNLNISNTIPKRHSIRNWKVCLLSNPFRQLHRLVRQTYTMNCVFCILGVMYRFMLFFTIGQ